VNILQIGNKMSRRKHQDVAKEHFIKALKSAGIDSKNVKIEQIGE